MPKNWFFDIYEDTPEEEAATLMEHSTLTLDLSSDEEGSKKERDDRGKENMPPEDYDAPTASRSVAEPAVAAPKHVKKIDIIRKKVVTDEMDDGQRSPLSDLETEFFVPEGLDKDSHVVINPTPGKESSSTKLDVDTLFAAPVPFTAGRPEKDMSNTPFKGVIDMPVVTANGDVKGDIIVWEDTPSSERTYSTSPTATDDAASQKAAVIDDNSQPPVDEVA